MISPRFVLVVSAESNLLRASLVTRNLHSVAFARQTFQLIESNDGTQEFDPAQVWYLMKKVIAACLDIGRTLSREIAGVVILAETDARVMWSQQGDEVVSHGYIGLEAGAFASVQDADCSGTLADWLRWNLTGGVTTRKGDEPGKTRARSPFDTELPIVAVLNPGEVGPKAVGGDGVVSTEPILLAAELGWKEFDILAGVKI